MVPSTWKKALPCLVCQNWALTTRFCFFGHNQASLTSYRIALLPPPQIQHILPNMVPFTQKKAPPHFVCQKWAPAAWFCFLATTGPLSCLTQSHPTTASITAYPTPIGMTTERLKLLVASNLNLAQQRLPSISRLYVIGSSHGTNILRPSLVLSHTVSVSCPYLQQILGIFSATTPRSHSSIINLIE